jgi:hypothetical protein
VGNANRNLTARSISEKRLWEKAIAPEHQWRMGSRILAPSVLLRREKTLSRVGGPGAAPRAGASRRIRPLADSKQATLMEQNRSEDFGNNGQRSALRVMSAGQRTYPNGLSALSPMALGPFLLMTMSKTEQPLQANCDWLVIERSAGRPAPFP